MRLTIFGIQAANRAMIHHQFDQTSAEKPLRPAPAPKRRLFGLREFVVLAIAFAMLALLPTTAQFGRNVEVRATDDFGSAEKPSENFAGSAFYFMDQTSIADTTPPPSYDTSVFSQNASFANATDPAMQVGTTGLNSTMGANLPVPKDTASFSGASAQPFVLRAGGEDYSRALKCLTDAIYYEAANEPDAGQRAVAQVIINRMRHPTYPNSICGVIYQGSERQTGCQFSYSCDGSMARIPARAAWLRGQRVAMQALSGYVFTPVGMATHYHATYVYPYWARFYSWKGSAGRPSAFFARHNGEPFPGPKPRAWSPRATPVLDPIQLQKQYERDYAAARLKAEAEARSGIQPTASTHPYADIQPGRARVAPQYAPPQYSREAQSRGGEAAYGSSNLPTNGNVRPEFQTSGSWKATPTG
jgi:spore germination cell wall hydrolase CwlJ-like protein